MLPAELHAAQVKQGTATALLARREWRKIASVDEFDRIAARLSLIVSAGQLGAARMAASSTVETIGEGVGSVDPAAFAGVASDGRPLGSLLYSPVVHARSLYGSGMTDAEVMESAGKRLGMIVQTQVADAWRGAAGVAIASTRQAGYVRVVSPPCCQRCAVLAGKVYKWNRGFDRHPRCDCVHYPTGVGGWDQGYTDFIGPEDIKDLTAAQRKAIDDGADMNQVINSHRAGARSADKMTTSEGTTRRGWNSYVKRKIAEQRGEVLATTAENVGRRGYVKNYVVRRTRPRITPEAIYKFAGDDREMAVRLLAKNGYIVGDLKKVAQLAL